MIRVDYLNEQLDLIYITEDLATVAKKVDVNKLQKAAQSKNKIQLLQALKDVPLMDIDQIKDVGTKKDKLFKKYYMEATKQLKGDETKMQKVFAASYACLKSMAIHFPSTAEYLTKQAAKLWDYMYKNSGGLALSGFSLSFILGLLSIVLIPFIFVLGPAYSATEYGAMVSAGMLTVGITLSIVKMVVNAFPR